MQKFVTPAIMMVVVFTLIGFRTWLTDSAPCDSFVMGYIPQNEMPLRCLKLDSAYVPENHLRSVAEMPTGVQTKRP